MLIKKISSNFFYFLLLIGATALLSLWSKGAFHKSLSNISCPECNVILISLDTLRAKSLPCYGYEKNTAPNLCAFADKAFLFENAYTHSAYTLDSHFSIFTSLYPSSHRMTTPFVSYLSEKIPTLPQILKSDGYETLYVGPFRDPHMPLDKGIERGFDRISEAYKPSEWITRMNQFDLKEKRFFIFLHSSEVHDPYTPVKENIPKFYSGSLDRYLSKQDLCEQTLLRLKGSQPEILPVEGQDDKKDQCQILYSVDRNEKDPSRVAVLLHETKVDAYRQTYEGMGTEEEIKYLQGLYDTKIYEQDLQLKQFFQRIEQEGLLKNTIIIITADHGEEFYEHGYWKHASNLYNESIHVPLIIYIPNTEPQRVDKLAQGIDILPSVLRVLGIETPDQAQGMNLFSDQKHQYIFSEHFMSDKQAVISQDWKLIVNNDIGDERIVELYNRKSDPNETINVESEFIEVVALHEQALKNHNASRRSFPQRLLNFPEWITEEEKKKLIETGYF